MAFSCAFCEETISVRKRGHGFISRQPSMRELHDYANAGCPTCTLVSACISQCVPADRQKESFEVFLRLDQHLNIEGFDIGNQSAESIPEKYFHVDIFRRGAKHSLRRKTRRAFTRLCSDSQGPSLLRRIRKRQTVCGYT